MQKFLFLSLRILIHIAVGVFFQAALLSVILFHYEIYPGFGVIVAVCFVWDLLVSRIFKAYPLRMNHLLGLLLTIPTFIVLIISLAQGGPLLGIIIVGTLNVTFVAEKVFLAKRS